MSTITEIQTSYYRIPLPELMEDAKHGLHTHFEVPIVKVRTDDGREGIGYTYTGGFGGESIAKLIDKELKHILLGKDPACVGSSLGTDELGHPLHCPRWSSKLCHCRL